MCRPICRPICRLCRIADMCTKVSLSDFSELTILMESYIG